MCWRSCQTPSPEAHCTESLEQIHTYRDWFTGSVLHPQVKGSPELISTANPEQSCLSGKLNRSAPSCRLCVFTDGTEKL